MDVHLMQTVWTLDADFTNAHFMQTIYKHLLSDRSSLQTDVLHTKNHWQMQLSMHKVYMCTLGAYKSADFMHTLRDRL
jgi:hypothetical protein